MRVLISDELIWNIFVTFWSRVPSESAAVVYILVVSLASADISAGLCFSSMALAIVTSCVC